VTRSRVFKKPPMQISVFLPTADRPDFLRMALSSVAAQTALSQVYEVVVIENLGNRDSEKVCSEFSELPIRYIFRDPPLPPSVDALENSLESIRGEYVAILFDDDWWLPEHLERSIRSHEFCCDVVASYSSYIFTTGEDGYWNSFHGNFAQWFAVSHHVNKERRIFEFNELLVAAVLQTAFQFSTLVAKREILLKCLDCIRDGNPYDTDRLISVELGLYGKVVVDPLPTVFLRTHSDQENIRLDNSGDAAIWWDKSSNYLLELAKVKGIDLREEFSIRMTASGIGLQVLEKYGNARNSINFLVTNKILDRSHNVKEPSKIKKIYRALTPPILQSLLTRVLK